MKQTAVLYSTLFFCVCYGLSLAACRPEVPPIVTPESTTPVATSTQAAEDRSGSYGADTNVLLEVRGDVRLRRTTWNGYYPVSLGTILHRGDMLQLGGDAIATVLCDDLTLWAVPGGGPQGVNNGCPLPEAPDIVRDGISLAPVRSPSSDIPYVISPRRTNIMNGAPLLRWKALADTAEYTVTVDQGRPQWTVQGDAFQYPGNPRLVPGEIYKVHVVTSDGRTSTEGQDLGFRLLTGDELDDVMGLVSRAEALSLPDEAEALALAYVYMSRSYAGWHLTADAIDRVEWLQQQGVESPAVAQFLGDLYLEIGLGNEARQAYETAARLAAAGDDTGAQAVALFALGKLLSVGNCEERVASVGVLEQAAAGYEELGDSEHSDEMRTWIPAQPLQACPTITPSS